MSITLPENVQLPQTGLMQALGQGLGGGFEKGIEKGLSNILKIQAAKQKEQVNLKKQILNYRDTFSKVIKNYDLISYAQDKPDKLNEIILKGQQALSQGLDEESVIQQSLTELAPNIFKKTSLNEKEQEYYQQEAEKKEQEEKRTLFGDVKQFLTKPSEKFQTGPKAVEGDPTLVKQIKQLNKHLAEVEKKQKELTIGERFKGTAQIGQNIASGLTLGLIPGKTLDEKYQHLQGASNFLKGVSEYMPIGGLLNIGKSLGTKTALRLFPNAMKTAQVAGLLGGATGGTISDVTRKTMETGKFPSLNEISKDFAKWTAFEAAFAAMPLIKRVNKSNVKQFVEKTGATEKEAAEYLKAKVTAEPAEGVAKEAAEKAKVIEKEVPKAEIGKEQLKEKVKARKIEAKKAAKSPIIEEIFEEKTPVKHRPETILKEEARIAEINEKIKPLRTQLKEASSELTSHRLDLRKATTASEKAAIQNSIDRVKFQQSELTDQIKDLQFEKKYKKPTPTREKISEQIETSFEKIREDIKNPKEVDPKKVEAIVARDKKAIETAEEIFKKRKTLTPVESDTFMKIKQQYSKAYGDMIKQNEQLIESLSEKGTARAKKAIAEAEQMNKVLERRQARAKADLIKHAEKKRLKKLAKDPFSRNDLSKLRQDIDLFKKQTFKQNRLKTFEQAKTQQATQKLFNEFKKNPTEANARKVAEAEGLSYETIKKDAKGLVKNAEKITDAKKFSSRIKDLLEKYKKLPKFKKAIVSGLLINAIQNTSEKLFGYKPSSTLIAFFVPGGIISKVGAGTISSALNKFQKKLFDSVKSKEYKKLESIAEKKSFIDNLKKKGISASRIKKIRGLAA